jgi:hypothetical protein
MILESFFDLDMQGGVIDSPQIQRNPIRLLMIKDQKNPLPRTDVLHFPYLRILIQLARIKPDFSSRP